jgi:4-alpha-glucanotransferase
MGGRIRRGRSSDQSQRWSPPAAAVGVRDVTAPRVGVQLQRLARAYDVQTSYRDLQGRDSFARPESLLAALRGMGVIDDAADVRAALRAHEIASWDWHIEPVVLAWGDGPAEATRAGRIAVRVPADALEGAGNLLIELEDGRAVERPFGKAKAGVTAEARISGRRYVELSLGLPAGLPYGYHRLHVDIGGRRMSACLIAAPRHAYAADQGPAWGVFLPLYALHSRRSWGIGDYTDLGRLTEWAGGRGASVVATLPLLPAFLGAIDEPQEPGRRGRTRRSVQRYPFEPSPYQPVSRLFWNEIFVDPEAPLEGGETPAVDPAIAEAARRLGEAQQVDYAAVMALKRSALEAQSKALRPGDEASRLFEAYKGGRPDVGDYAAFRAAMETLGPDWRRWPKRQREGRLRPVDYDAATARYFEFAQWRAHCQMHGVKNTATALGMRSYLDLPVGVHAQGYDAWRHRALFGQGLSVGAPPDLLATNGQNWGFQPLLPRALRATSYEYVVKYLRHYFASAKMLRIDHAIGLHRLYWIPEGGTGADGVFVRQPSEEMYAVLCLESLRAEAVVIAEDLGLVPPEVRRGLRAHGISNMYVQMFEMTGRQSQPLRPPHPHAAASFGTHDLPPFAAYWQDEDLRQREELGLITPVRAATERADRTRNRKALIRHLKERGLVRDESDVGQVFRGSAALLAESQAEWVMLNLEDTWNETRAQNLPGTSSDQHPNWTSRAAYGLDDLDSIEGLTKAVETVRLYRPARRKRRTTAGSGKRTSGTQGQTDTNQEASKGEEDIGKPGSGRAPSSSSGRRRKES